jgi:hypothetical protein
MLRFLVQTFYQLLFSQSFPFSNFPAILFPSAILSPSKSFPHQKAQSKRIKPKHQKTQAPTAPQTKSQRQKAKPSGKKQKPQALLKWAFY